MLFPVLQDVRRKLFSTAPLAWGQILFLWIAGLLLLGGSAYLVKSLERERRQQIEWATFAWRGAYSTPQGPSLRELHWADSVSSIARDKASVYRATEILLIAATAMMLLFLLGRSFYGAGRPISDDRARR